MQILFAFYLRSHRITKYVTFRVRPSIWIKRIQDVKVEREVTLEVFVTNQIKHHDDLFM